MEAPQAQFSNTNFYYSRQFSTAAPLVSSNNTMKIVESEVDLRPAQTDERMLSAKRV
jgi:hypothetical protein